jgi:hypothetical protein
MHLLLRATDRRAAPAPRPPLPAYHPGQPPSHCFMAPCYSCLQLNSSLDRVQINPPGKIITDIAREFINCDDLNKGHNEVVVAEGDPLQEVLWLLSTPFQIVFSKYISFYCVSRYNAY